MGRDIDFAQNEINYVSKKLDYSIKRESFVTYDAKTHRTGLHDSDENYEDYGILMWLDHNGSPRKKGKKHVLYELESYQPKDFVKTWKVSIAPGDYKLTVLFDLVSGDVSVALSRIERIEYLGCKRNFSLSDTDGNLIYEDLERKYKLHEEKVGVVCGNIHTKEEILEEICHTFEAKFWTLLEDIIEIPEFKALKHYNEIHP